MSRRVVLLLGAALILRCGLAVADQIRPIFSAHHYSDARNYDSEARKIARAWREGKRPEVELSSGRELYTFWTAALYAAVSPRPIVPRLANALMGVLCLFLWFRLADSLLGRRAAEITLFLFAFWPSHVFLSSQHLRESPHLLALTAALTFFLQAWSRTERGVSIGSPRLDYLAGALCLVGTGFFRLHHVPLAAAGLLAGGAFGVLKEWRRPDRAVVFAEGCLWVAGALFAAQPLVAASRPRLLNAGPRAPASMAAVRENASPGSARKFSLASPRGLSDYREFLLYSSRLYSETSLHRSVETQIFPDARFETWTDLIRFVPKASAYALFMPLPGLYPTGGKLGRKLSSVENLGLVALAVLAALGWFDRRRSVPAATLAAFLLLAVPATSVFEFDLGSASRHRQLYFLIMIPFAAARIDKMLPGRRTA